MSGSVAAIVVTYNRKHLVVECVRALLNQTRKLERIFLVDNGSTDGTREHLVGSRLLDAGSVEYVRVDKNAGATNGFSIGIDRGLAEGYDWLWVMDDDAEPASDALERLAEHFDGLGEASSALACLVVDENGTPVPYHSGRLNMSNPFRPLVRPVRAVAESAPIDVDHASFVGLCIRREAVAEVGLPDERLFIHADDLEYCDRLRQHGKIFLIPSSRIAHKEAAKEGKFVQRRLGFLARHRVSYDKLWMQYFIRRNSVNFMKRRARSRLGFWLWLTVTIARSAGAILLFDDHKGRRLRFVLGSVADGLSGRFDNDRPRRLLYDEASGGR